MSTSASEFITITIINNKPFFTNTKGWAKIRQQFRVVGLTFSDSESQYVELMPEEANILNCLNLAEYRPANAQLQISCQNKLTIFMELWSFGLFLTSGQKFGCDYLAYKQEVGKGHADFLVHCCGSVFDKPIHISSLITKARIANSVKKIPVFSFFDSNAKSHFISIKWVTFNAKKITCLETKTP